MMDDLRYPIGKYTPPREISMSQVQGWIDEIAALPQNLRALVSPFNAQQLDTPYRPDGWTVRQVVHHLCDSHLNSLVRFKLALTEDAPTVKPYDEARWALTAEYQLLPVESSLDFLDKLHERWVVLLRSLSESEMQKKYRHPEIGDISLAWTVGLYAWHCRHHFAHIQQLAAREGWE